MNTPLSWIKAYVPELDCSVKEYCDAMTLSGTKVESAALLDKNLSKIVVGKVLSIDKHPNADKLVVTKVQIDKEGNTIQIVTGAPNIKVGDLVPTVLDGGRVAGLHAAGEGAASAEGFEIKAGELRGVPSYGMMCSIEELGSSRDVYPDAPADGVYIFSDNPSYEGIQPGDDAIEILGLRDALVEYEITSNRVDCYGVIGIAREAAATFRKPFNPPVIPETGNNEDVNDYVAVDVKADDLCTRYIARVVKNIKIGPSPLWMQHRLQAEGIRPINNIVDITNYVMEEYGQPMHAYDLDMVEGDDTHAHKIVVRRADNGEKFTTLDGKEYELDDRALMICDGKKSIGLAGIMGGQNSMITDNVKTMLFEAATFDGTNIRLTERRIGIHTDASGKFNKGLCPDTALEAINRACALVEELGAGEVVGGLVDSYKNPWHEKHLKWSYERTNKVLGTNISKEDMISYFKNEGLSYDEAAGEVIVPTFRQDLNEQCDLDEEVARFFGYANIPTTLPSGASMSGGQPFKMRIEDLCREVARSYGYYEAQTYSFESNKVFDKLLLKENDPKRNAIQIRNPLGPEFAAMRTLPVNGILASLSTNFNRKNKNVKLFEIANIYLAKALPLTELPDERKQLTFAFYGENEKNQGFYEMKGVVEEVLEKCGLIGKNVGKVGGDAYVEGLNQNVGELAASAKGELSYDANSGITFLHPYRQANIVYDGKVIGYIGQVHPLVEKNYGIGESTYLAVLDLKDVVARASLDVKYTPIVNLPLVNRDISLVVKENVTHAQIESIIRSAGGEHLENVALFDIYVGEKIQQGYKSMAYSISFRGKEKTLTEDEITGAMNNIIEALAKNDIVLRTE